MKNLNKKGNRLNNNDKGFSSGERNSVSKDKSSKRKLSIYDDYDDDDDSYTSREKFKKRPK